jgi:hypothetical protein
MSNAYEYFLESFPDLVVAVIKCLNKNQNALVVMNNTHALNGENLDDPTPENEKQEVEVAVLEIYEKYVDFFSSPRPKPGMIPIEYVWFPRGTTIDTPKLFGTASVCVVTSADSGALSPKHLVKQ